MKDYKKTITISCSIVFCIFLYLGIIISLINGRRPPILPTQIETILGRIRIIENKLQKFVKEFPVRKNLVTDSVSSGFPSRKEFAGLVVDGVKVEEMTGGEFLRLMLFPTQDEIDKYLRNFGITHSILNWEDAKELFNSHIAYDDWDDREIQINMAFVDAWNKPFYYRYPGLNHSNHKNIENKFGADNASLKKPDIWSIGPNSENDEKNWEKHENDPYGQSEFNDDITNWFKYDD